MYEPGLSLDTHSRPALSLGQQRSWPVRTGPKHEKRTALWEDTRPQMWCMPDQTITRRGAIGFERKEPDRSSLREHPGRTRLQAPFLAQVPLRYTVHLFPAL